MTVKIHFIDEDSSKIVLYETASHVPRAGDEVRLEGEVFYTVTRVVWCMDEPTALERMRANVGLRMVKK